MIDALYARYSRKKEKPLDPKYRPSDAIAGRRHLKPSAKRLVVIFPGWHTHSFPVSILAGRLARRGWSVLVYDFHDQVIMPDDDAVRDSFKFIRDKIALELSQLKSKHGYERVHLVGISLGNVPLALVTDLYKDFQSATLVVAGDDLAIDLWHGTRTSYLDPIFQKMHVGVRKLDDEWHLLAPANHAAHFRHKPVKFIMSTRDSFILSKYQQRMLDSLQEIEAVVNVKKRRTGHLITIIRYCIFDRPL